MGLIIGVVIGTLVFAVVVVVISILVLSFGVTHFKKGTKDECNLWQKSTT